MIYLKSLKSKSKYLILWSRWTLQRKGQGSAINNSEWSISSIREGGISNPSTIDTSRHTSVSKCPTHTSRKGSTPKSNKHAESCQGKGLATLLNAISLTSEEAWFAGNTPCSNKDWWRIDIRLRENQWVWSSSQSIEIFWPPSLTSTKIRWVFWMRRKKSTSLFTSPRERYPTYQSILNPSSWKN